MEWKTNKGQALTFSWEEDVEVENRGWIVHKLTVFVEGVEAGYLRASYIPSENWERFYPDITYYLSKILGKCGLDSDDPDTKLKYLSHEAEAWHNWLSDNKLALMDEAEKTERMARYMTVMEEKYGEEFREDYSFHVDKPLVDFIHLDEEFRGQDIPKAMYYEAAVRLAEKGFVLYRSGVQSEGAIQAWEKMKIDPFFNQYISTEHSLHSGKYGKRRQRDYFSLLPVIEEKVGTLNNKKEKRTRI